MDNVTLRRFESQDAAAFKALNLAWIEVHFSVEESDRKQLEAPEETLIAKGGQILVAEREGTVIGTVGLVPAHEPKTVELVKMAVDESAQGLGVGKALLNAAIDEARDMGFSKIWLETNSVLKAATKLYERAGFRRLGEGEHTTTPYSRCNAQFIYEL